MAVGKLLRTGRAPLDQLEFEGQGLAGQRVVEIDVDHAHAELDDPPLDPPTISAPQSFA